MFPLIVQGAIGKIPTGTIIDSHGKNEDFSYQNVVYWKTNKNSESVKSKYMGDSL